MTESIESEIQAIKSVLTALEPLEQDIRESVLHYVARRLRITMATEQEPQIPLDHFGSTETEPSFSKDNRAEEVHIQELVNEKKPRSAIEMATLVAYYLSHKAPKADRKQTITTKDIETYFKIGGVKLPSKPQFTLPNTKAAGYLDSTGGGEYRLNPVGYNLVVHSMPKAKNQSAKISRKSHKAKSSRAKK